ncbi:hypothetical protein QV08_08835 [Gallibacterium salpingitidis]|uniref:Uncharacterized protein n=1 Tax=Gallibacterium salpingitidis TaxID=505341 RepID=A0AB36E408_9PAST|nr:STY4528 family pathogenicity island replication protein [Gallibacterium salpingitidis]OBX06922.1 hypothetical protein QV08_08835 [Gallibacterium salpingitidis]OBX11420.1 hypothetical protein QV09_02745 [Gallibacterium salpingitidis]
MTDNNAGLFYFGNAHETVPIRLLQDRYLTVRAKYTWQMIRYHAKAFTGNLFPSYEKLQDLLSDKLYLHEKVSRKIVSQTLLLLRLTRWLTLCDTKRDKQGRILGNIYIIHDEPMSVTDVIHFDTHYFELLSEATKHNDKIVKSVALHIMEELQSDDSNAHFVSHFTLMQKRFNEHQQSILKSNRNIPQTAQIMQELLTQNNEMELNKQNKNLQSSIKELSENQEKRLSSNRELSKKSQSSIRELSENDANLQSSIKELCNNQDNLDDFCTELSKNHLVPQLSTSTSTSNINTKYSTSTTQLNFKSIELTSLEKNTIITLAKQLNLSSELIQDVLNEADYRIQQGSIQKPLNYICGLLRKAHKGAFNQYIDKFKDKLSEITKQPSRQPNTLNTPILTKQRNAEDRAKILSFAKELAAQLTVQ